MIYYIPYMSSYQKRALITGIAGQDGSYLAELLVKKSYKVFGLVRNLKKDALRNIAELYKNKKVILIKGDLNNLKSIENAIRIAQPDEVYNLAAQSDEVQSFKLSKETYNVNYRGFGYLVDTAMRLNPKIKIFQAGSSKMFAKVKPLQSEKTPFRPISPYGKAKLKAHNKYVLGYRKKYNLFICSGILFSHESPRRGENFIASKIARSMVKIKLGLLDSFELGNVDIKRDWGFAPDYIEAMWMMLQQKTPQDFVIATGVSYSIRDFINEIAKFLGMNITWRGKGLEEIAKDKNGRVVLRISKKYYSPTSIYYAFGNNAKIKKILGWKPKHSFKDLVKIMVEADLKKERKNILNN